MQVKVHSIHFDADKTLIEFVQDRVNKLEHFYDHIIGGEVYLRLDKSESRDNKISEIKILIPGKELFAKKQGKSFEEATDETIAALRRQIEKVKGKQLDRTS